MLIETLKCESVNHNEKMYAARFVRKIPITKPSEENKIPVSIVFTYTVAISEDFVMPGFVPGKDYSITIDDPSKKSSEG